MQNEVDQARPGRRSRKYPIIRTLSVAVHRLRLARRTCSRYCFVSALFAITISTVTVATTFLAVRLPRRVVPAVRSGAPVRGGLRSVDERAEQRQPKSAAERAAERELRFGGATLRQSKAHRTKAALAS